MLLRGTSGKLNALLRSARLVQQQGVVLKRRRTRIVGLHAEEKMCHHWARTVAGIQALSTRQGANLEDTETRPYIIYIYTTGTV